MKIALLTTDTTHHRYFCWKLQDRFPIDLVLLESRSAKPDFETHHSFEDQRDVYEREELLRGCPQSFDEMTQTCTVETANHPDALSLLSQVNADIGLVFGTGKLQSAAIDAFSLACLNLHGGNPEEYRGLDTHLWAMYHNDFANLVTTLHVVAAAFDTGDIVEQQLLPLTSQTELHQVRAINTNVCVDLCVNTLVKVELEGRFNRRKQTTRGRYYSFMPSALKEECRKKFTRHVGSL